MTVLGPEKKNGRMDGSGPCLRPCQAPPVLRYYIPESRQVILISIPSERKDWQIMTHIADSSINK